jgi:hypothetical protein
LIARIKINIPSHVAVIIFTVIQFGPVFIVTSGHGFAKCGFNPIPKRLSEFALTFGEFLEVLAEVFSHVLLQLNKFPSFHFIAKVGLVMTPLKVNLILIVKKPISPTGEIGIV